MSDKISAKIKEEFDKLINEILEQHDYAEPDHIGDYTIKITQEIRRTELHIQHFVVNYKEIADSES